MRGFAILGLATLILWIASPGAQAKDFHFTIQGRFNVQEFNIGTVCKDVRGNIGLVLMAETPTDAVHGHASALIEEDKVEFWIHLFETTGPRFSPFKKRNSWLFQRKLKRVLKRNFRAASRTDIQFFEIRAKTK